MQNAMQNAMGGWRVRVSGEIYVVVVVGGGDSGRRKA